jgi:hypothetical protein
LERNTYCVPFPRVAGENLLGQREAELKCAQRFLEGLIDLDPLERLFDERGLLFRLGAVVQRRNLEGAATNEDFLELQAGFHLIVVQHFLIDGPALAADDLVGGEEVDAAVAHAGHGCEQVVAQHHALAFDGARASGGGEIDSIAVGGHARAAVAISEERADAISELHVEAPSPHIIAEGRAGVAFLGGRSNRTTLTREGG